GSLQPRGVGLRPIVRAEQVRNGLGDRRGAHGRAHAHHHRLRTHPVQGGGVLMRIRPRKTLRVFLQALGIIACLIFFLLPAYWMISTAVDPAAAIRGGNVLPQGFTLGHFERVLGQAGFGRFMANSALVATVTVGLSALLALLAATAVARFRFKSRTAILIAQMVPLEALVIPLFLQARNLQMLSSLLGLSIVYLAFSVPFAVWMLRGFVAAVPIEVEEAAYIDGASWNRMFWSILFPLVA